MVSKDTNPPADWKYRGTQLKCSAAKSRRGWALRNCVRAPRRSITLLVSLAYRFLPFQTESKHSATKHLKAQIYRKGARDLGVHTVQYAVVPFVA